MAHNNTTEQKRFYDSLGYSSKLRQAHPQGGVEAVRRYYVSSPASSFLDLGCGRGAWASALANVDSGMVTGLDISVENLKKANEHYPEMRFVQGNAGALPFGDNSFDVVFAGSTLHHLPNLKGVFREVSRVLKKGGIFYAFEPSGFGLYTLALYTLSAVALRLFGRRTISRLPRLCHLFVHPDFTPGERALFPTSISAMSKAAGFANVEFFFSLDLGRPPVLRRLLRRYPYCSNPLLCNNFLMRARK